MGLIKKATELTLPSTVKIMVYGQAGTGKTTFALSAPKPLLLDFDGGVARVNATHLEGVDTVQVQSWDDIKAVLQEDLSAYRTIVTDTIGKMMDFIITGSCGAKQPTIKDWGRINAEFQWFTRTVSSLGKNLVFIAHRDTRKDGDDTVFVPSLREKNYTAIVTDLDLLGYMEMRSVNGKQVRTVTFDPTSRNDGKNTCNLPAVMSVPCIVEKGTGKALGANDFIEREILAPYTQMLQAKARERKRYEAVTREIAADIEAITDAAGANAFVGRIKEYDHCGSSMQYAKVHFSQKVNALGLKLDGATKLYTDPAGEKAEEKEQEKTAEITAA